MALHLPFRYFQSSTAITSLQTDETFASTLQFIGTYREGEENTCDQFKCDEMGAPCSMHVLDQIGLQALIRKPEVKLREDFSVHKLSHFEKH
jgi:hypothetical protein